MGPAKSRRTRSLQTITLGKTSITTIMGGGSNVGSLGGQFLVRCGVCNEEVPVQSYKDHAAVCKLSMNLKQAEFAIPITHGETRVWKKAKFQGHAAPVRYLEDVEYVVQQLQSSLPWSSAKFHACAYRLSINAAGGAGEDHPEEATVLEGRSDGKDPGVGDKLLYLLQRWEVQNVVLVVTAWDDGIRGRLGAARYRVYLEQAKAVLEQCYMEAIQAGEVASDSEQSMATASNANNGVSSSDQSNGATSSSVMFPSKSSMTDDSSRQGGGQSSSAAGVSTETSSQAVGRSRLEKGVNFAEEYAAVRNRINAVKNRPTMAMKPVVMTSETVDFPKGKLVNGFYVGKKKGRPNHFLDGRIEVPLHGMVQDPMNARLQGQQQAELPLIDEVRSVPLPQFTREQLFEAKRILRPHEHVHRVFYCVAQLLGYSDTSWPGCREMISGEHFLREIVMIDIARIGAERIDLVRGELMDRTFNPERTRRQSLLAADLLVWCIHVVQEFDRVTAGIEPRNNMHMELGEVEILKGKAVVPLIPRRVTLGDNIEMSRVQGRTATKKPLTAPLYARNDTGPPKVSVPKLGRRKINTMAGGLGIEGTSARTISSGTDWQSQKRSTYRSHGKSYGDGESVRVSSRFTNRSSAPSRGSSRGEVSKW